MKRINKAWVILFFLGGAYANEKSYLEDPLYAEGVFEEQQAMDMNNKYESLGNKLSAKESMDITNKVNEHYNNALALYIKSAEKGGTKYMSFKELKARFDYLTSKNLADLWVSFLEERPLAYSFIWKYKK